MGTNRPETNRRQGAARAMGLFVWLGCWVFLLAPFRVVEPRFGSASLTIDCPGPILVGRLNDEDVMRYCDAGTERLMIGLLGIGLVVPTGTFIAYRLVALSSRSELDVTKASS